jgi:hypothetical protein
MAIGKEGGGLQIKRATVMGDALLQAKVTS